MTEGPPRPPAPGIRPAKDRFDWERAIMGPNGPRMPTTRHVLLTLATHIRRGRLYAWPGLRKLEAETALSNRSVIDHLEIAVDEGWLRKEITKRPEMRYRAAVYSIQIPASAEAPSPHPGERGSPPHGNGSGEPPSPQRAPNPQQSAGGEVGAPSGERPAAETVNVLPRTSMNKEVEQKRRIGEELIELGRAAKLAVKSAAEWGRELGIVKGNGEHEGDYQVRVMQALEAWKKGAVPSLSKPPRSMSND